MIDLMNNGLKIYLKKNTKFVSNDNEQWAEKIYVKKNTKIVWNNNGQWAENLCIKEYQVCLE